MSESQRPRETIGGRYEILTLVGVGGMGAVYAARDLALGRQVAIKVPRSNPEGLDRFLREARLLASLSNEHIVRILDVISFAGGPAVVMELLVGEDLSTVLRARGSLSQGEAVRIIAQAAVGLADAHGRSVVHRDLKPSNLFLTRQFGRDPIVKILDFGIAKLRAGLPSTYRTETGAPLGTPAYMAPEQVRNARDADSRADIWSLGVILYRMVAGALPFAASQPWLVMSAIVNDRPPDLGEAAPHVHPTLRAAIMRCLEKDPDRRPSSVTELVDHLAPFLPSDVGHLPARIRRMTGPAGHAVLSTVSATIAAAPLTDPPLVLGSVIARTGPTSSRAPIVGLVFMILVAVALAIALALVLATRSAASSRAALFWSPQGWIPPSSPPSSLAAS